MCIGVDDQLQEAGDEDIWGMQWEMGKLSAFVE